MVFNYIAHFKYRGNLQELAGYLVTLLHCQIASSLIAPNESQIAPSKKSCSIKCSEVRPSSLRINDLEYFSFFKREKSVTWLGAI